MSALPTRAVRVYDTDGNTRIEIELRIGDTVTWKRNGMRGAYKALVERFTTKTIRLRLLSHDGLDCPPETFANAQGGFLAAWRDGHRITARRG